MASGRKHAHRRDRQQQNTLLRQQQRGDHDARAALAQADSLKTSFWFTATPPDWRPPAVATAPRVVSFPAGVDGGPGRRSRSCWALATVTMVTEPWRPAPGDETPEAADWTADLVRARLVEAMETLRLCRGDGPAGPRSAMPDAVREAVTAYGWSEARVRRHPTTAELARLDEVLTWLFLLDDAAERKALVGVAMGLSLRRIGRAIGCSHTHTRALERRAVDRIVGWLNG